MHSFPTETKALDSALINSLAEILSTGASEPRTLKPSQEHGLPSLVICRLNDPERPGISYGIALALDASGRTPDPTSSLGLLKRFAGVIGGGLETLTSRNRALTRERDRAGINLSRNLGHDLTNIIATSKLELMTLAQIVGSGEIPNSGPKREILGESLQGLLDSTKFLQEVVNLYRAYAYLKEPTLETHEPNPLVAETVRLFRLSTSEKVRIIEQPDPAAPKFRVDPRLFKLALFNLFSNAVDAIRRGSDGNDQGEITVATGHIVSSDGAESLTVTVRDSGCGIRDESGALASPETIEQIFQLGYSVGREGQGEGLGLNWVRTIVRDIHGGAIKAENAPQGGAMFTLIFPPLVYEKHSAVT